MTAAAILAFERQAWTYPGAKDAAIRDQFGVTSTAYYAELSRVLEDPASPAIDAQTVRRLVRLRDRRRAQRSAGR